MLQRQGIMHVHAQSSTHAVSGPHKPFRPVARASLRRTQQEHQLHQPQTAHCWAAWHRPVHRRTSNAMAAHTQARLDAAGSRSHKSQRPCMPDPSLMTQEQSGAHRQWQHRRGPRLCGPAPGPPHPAPPEPGRRSAAPPPAGPMPAAWPPQHLQPMASLTTAAQDIIA